MAYRWPTDGQGDVNDLVTPKIKSGHNQGHKYPNTSSKYPTLVPAKKKRSKLPKKVPDKSIRSQTAKGSKKSAFSPQ